MEDFEPLLHLDVEDHRVLDSVLKRCQRALEREWITPRQKWLGVWHAKEIQSGFFCPARVEWIDPVLKYGVFADRDLPAHSFVGEYTGILRRRPLFRKKRNDYCFEYTIGDSRGSPFLIDAEPAGSLARFINHSATPNLEPVSVYCGGMMHIILITLRPIPKGSQLCYDYGPDYWAKRQSPERI
jgi:SET domain-containing protein